MRHAGLVLLVVALASCEVPLDPIAPSDFTFSLSGYLDASADTQWVRVESVARTTDPDPEPLDAVVTLTDLVAGTTTEMTQVVRALPTGPAHLFWTTDDVAFGGRYRLDARRADGASTTTEIEIPLENSFTVEVQTGELICPTFIVVRGAERVVDVQARYVIFKDGRFQSFAFTKSADLRRLSSGGTEGSIYFGDDAVRMGLNPLDLGAVVEAEVKVGVSTTAWPDLTDVTLEDVLFSEGFGVEGGLGFVGGVVTETRPFEPGVQRVGFAGRAPCRRP